MIEDLEDNYENYLDDVLGYTWDAWDTLTLGDIQKHDTILGSDKESREKIDLGITDDLNRWAYCRAARRDEDSQDYLQSVRLILAGELSQIGLAYSEIFAHAIVELADQQLFDEAQLFLDQAREKFPDEIDFDRVEANLRFREQSQKIDPFRDAQNKHPEDAEFAFDLAEDLLLLGEIEGAEELAETCKRVATDAGLTAIMVDLASLERRIIRARTSA